MAEELKLPLVELLVDLFSDQDFFNVKIIGAQHILETTHSMLRSLYRVGLQPKNVSLIGKCYSTCLEVYEEMIAEGINVSKSSFTYTSHKSFDEQYSSEVQKFLVDQINDLEENEYDKVILLDDGGKCIDFFNKINKPNKKIISIEQTSAGYNEIKHKQLFFPVVNVARSPAKLNLESPIIAEAAAERLYQSLFQRDLFPKRALIIGGGPIGQAMKSRLGGDMLIDVYDENNELSDIKQDLGSILHLYPLIVGCTGKRSIPNRLHSKIKQGTILVSVSSSDREFDSVYLKNKLIENHNCHEDLLIQGKLLIRSGFPVNFDGNRENIEPEKIQLTIALITAAIFQALKIELDHEAGIIPLDPEIEARIAEEFLATHQDGVLVAHGR